MESSQSVRCCPFPRSCIKTHSDKKCWKKHEHSGCKWRCAHACMKPSGKFEFPTRDPNQRKLQEACSQW